MIAIYIFGFSLVVVFGMILSRVYELKHHQAHLISRLIARFDNLTEAKKEAFFGKYHLTKSSLNTFFKDEIPGQIGELTGSLSRKLGEVSDSLYGRRVLRNRGAVSFFLQRMSAEKGQVTGRQVNIENK